MDINAGLGGAVVMLIDTHLDATPSDITASATAIGNVTSHVDGAEDDLISARKSVCELEGSSAIAASGSISTSVADCEGLVSNLGSYKTALDNLASALSSVKRICRGSETRRPRVACFSMGRPCTTRPPSWRRPQTAVAAPGE